MSDPEGSERVIPFSQGSQFCCWVDDNCDQCHKGHDEVSCTYNCDIQEALDEACFGDGTVSKAIASRMGITPENKLAYTWRCGEFARQAPAVEIRPSDLPGQGLLFGGDGEAEET